MLQRKIKHDVINGSSERGRVAEQRRVAILYQVEMGLSDKEGDI